MPLYFFHVRTGNRLSEDEDGAEFADLAAVEEEARASVLEIAQYTIEGDIDSVSVEVRDEDGEHVLTATASIAVTRQAGH